MIQSNTETIAYITDLLLSACSTGQNAVTKAIEQFTHTVPNADQYLLSILLNSIPLPSKASSSPGLADEDQSDGRNSAKKPLENTTII